MQVAAQHRAMRGMKSTVGLLFVLAVFVPKAEALPTIRSWVTSRGKTGGSASGNHLCPDSVFLLDGPVVCFDFLEGLRDQDFGNDVCYSIEGGNIVATISASAESGFDVCHFHVGGSADDIPRNKLGPVPGQFEGECSIVSNGDCKCTFPLSDIQNSDGNNDGTCCGDTILAAAHASLSVGGTAWAGAEDIGGKFATAPELKLRCNCEPCDDTCLDAKTAVGQVCDTTVGQCGPEVSTAKSCIDEDECTEDICVGKGKCENTDTITDGTILADKACCETKDCESLSIGQLTCSVEVCTCSTTCCGNDCCVNTATGDDKDQNCDDGPKLCGGDSGNPVDLDEIGTTCYVCENNLLGGGKDFGCNESMKLCNAGENMLGDSCEVCLNDEGPTDVDSGCSGETRACNAESEEYGAKCVPCINDHSADSTDSGCSVAESFCGGGDGDTVDKDAVGTTCYVCEETDDVTDPGCTADEPVCGPAMGVLGLECFTCQNNNDGDAEDIGCSGSTKLCDAAKDAYGDRCVVCKSEDDDQSGIDDGCTETLKFCQADPGTAGEVCVECTSAGTCPVGDDCNVAVCTAGKCGFRKLENCCINDEEGVVRDQECNMTHPICGGGDGDTVDKDAVGTTCYVCEETDAMTDPGCTADEPVCGPAVGDLGLECFTCVNDMDGSKDDTGCGDGTPFCRADKEEYGEVCVACQMKGDCDDGNACTINTCSSLGMCEEEDVSIVDGTVTSGSFCCESADCMGTSTCEMNECTPPACTPTGTSCCSTTDCEDGTTSGIPGSVCISGSCVCDEMNCFGVKNLGGGDGSVCNLDCACQEACDGSGTCGLDSLCPSCSISSQCGSTSSCINGVCVPDAFCGGEKEKLCDAAFDAIVGGTENPAKCCPGNSNCARTQLGLPETAVCSTSCGSSCLGQQQGATDDYPVVMCGFGSLGAELGLADCTTDITEPACVQEPITTGNCAGGEGQKGCSGDNTVCCATDPKAPQPPLCDA